jgi:hypothetical protein
MSWVRLGLNSTFPTGMWLPLPGIRFKTGVMMILMRIAGCLSAQHPLLMLFLQCRPQLSRTRKS